MEDRKPRKKTFLLARLTLDDEEETKKRFYRYIYKDKLLAAKKLLTRIKNSVGHDKVVEDTRAYFVNNWNAIQRRECYFQTSARALIEAQPAKRNPPQR